MDYIEIQFALKERVPIIDIFIQDIADLGFDAFQENLNILSSYIPSITYNEKNLQELVNIYSEFIISFKSINHPHENWTKNGVSYI